MNFSDLELPSNRKFGYFFTAVFGLATAYFSYVGAGKTSFILFLIAQLLLLTTAVNADWLLPLNKLWMRFGLLLGMIVSPVVMGIIFFGLFTPISLIMRLFGRDELRLKLTSRESHWKERDSSATQDDTFKYQF